MRSSAAAGAAATKAGWLRASAVVRHVTLPEAEARWLWAAVLIFVSVSLWWLTQDNRVPDFDSGVHMIYSIVAHDQLAAGHLSAPFTDYNTYPPLVHLVGAGTIFVLGVHPMAMILASNIVFVPLLAFGCYGTGRLVAGPRAGLLAGLFALGTPIFVSMMHEYDLDPPQAALVAVTVWTLLASRRFERIGVSALAGAVFGLALLTKETSIVFVAGLLGVILVRGGWRHWRGLLAFIFVLENVAGPWYVYHLSQLRETFTSIGGLAANPVQAPLRYSTANVGWYLWNLLNVQTLTVLGGLFIIGTLIAVWRCARRRISTDNLYPELLGGGAFSYLGMTYLTHKDPRYTLPALVYIAVLGTSWILTVGRPWIRRSLTAAVVVFSGLYFSGMSFGIGGTVRLALPGAQTSIIYPRQLTLYETFGWVRGGPQQDGHVLSLLKGLRRAGFTYVAIDPSANEFDFNSNGITALASSAGLFVAPTPPPGSALLLLHNRVRGDPAPCQTLNDGRGVYVVRGNFAGLDPLTLRNPVRPGQRVDLFCPGGA